MARRTCGKHFVTDKEAGEIVVLLECVHNLGKGITLGLIPARCGLGNSQHLGQVQGALRMSYLLDLRIERVQVQPNVDASIGKCLHAIVVVGIRVDVVDAYRVGANLLHQRRVELALVIVDERVVGDQLVGDSCMGVNE